MDSSQTCTYILLEDAKEVIIFWSPWPIFKVTRDQRLNNSLSEWIDGFGQNLYIYILLIQRLGVRSQPGPILFHRLIMN